MSLFRRDKSPVWIDEETTDRDPFPDVESAMPYGLLAVGGNLRPEMLLTAYRRGIFPWYDPDEAILWWSPDPRYVLYPEQLKVSRSLRRTVRQKTFSVTIDQAFDDVLRGCAVPRPGDVGSWLGEEMQDAYRELHREGFAHSVEAWHDGELAGGLYGVAIGRVFFGESMFHRETDASKVCLVHLCEWLQEWDYEVIDCQIASGHLEQFGAEPMDRSEFTTLLERCCEQSPADNAWTTPTE